MSKKVRIIPLGGLGEIGKNLTVFETDNDMIIIDCGVAFPEDSMLGVDLVIPDMTYIKKNANKLRGIFITHAHEDHIGSLPFLLKDVNVPIYATKFTLKVIKSKLAESEQNKKVKTKAINPRQSVILGDFKIEFINVNHSIPGAVAMAITTPCGTIVHTGDFKIDMTPTYGEPIDLRRLNEYGSKGVKLLMCESTNAERLGFTTSEIMVKNSIKDLFVKYAKKRITVATFSSNVYRLQSVVKAALKQNRKIVLIGRSMLNISEVAMEEGILQIPEESLITAEESLNYENNEICIITTGSQGEPMSALYRMALNDRRSLSLTEDDVVILSSHTIPGNEQLVNTVLNKLAEKNVTVLNDCNVQNIHASGHACQEELKILQNIINPEYLMPVHGEFKHMKANKDLSMTLGRQADKTIISSNGRVVEMTDEGVFLTDEYVSCKETYVDGSLIGDVGPVIIRDRQILSHSGIIVIVMVAKLGQKSMLLTRPDVISKGFIYIKESNEFITEIKNIAEREFNKCVEENIFDEKNIKDRIRTAVYEFTTNTTGRKPMIIPVLETI